MIIELLTFGGVMFWILFTAFCILEITLLFNDEQPAAITGAVAFIIAMLTVVGGLPALTWHFLAAYALGAFVWVPVYWYLRLRHNHRMLLRDSNEYERTKYGTWRNAPSGMKADGRWLPNHPENAALVANGLMWPLAAPLYLGQDWINWIVDMFRGLMNKIQDSLSVAATPD